MAIYGESLMWEHYHHARAAVRPRAGIPFAVDYIKWMFKTAHCAFSTYIRKLYMTHSLQSISIHTSDSDNVPV